MYISPRDLLKIYYSFQKGEKKYVSFTYILFELEFFFLEPDHLYFIFMKPLRKLEKIKYIFDVMETKIRIL